MNKKSHKCTGKCCRIKKISGKDWLKLSKRGKESRVGELFDIYKLDRNKYSVNKSVSLLDSHYCMAKNKSKTDKSTILSLSVAAVFANIVKDDLTPWGIKSTEK